MLDCQLTVLLVEVVRKFAACMRRTREDTRGAP